MFADGANLDEMRINRGNPLVSGFTTNPTLMRNSQISNYLEFASLATKIAEPLPISFEVFADDATNMISQAKKLSALGENIFVKLPVTFTNGKLTNDVAQKLNQDGVKLNITAIMTIAQVKGYLTSLDPSISNIFSIFAGRIADTGVDPAPIVKHCKNLIIDYPNWNILWASPREILNLRQAENVGCDIITMSQDLWKKLPLQGKDLNLYSKETVLMFYNDAIKSNFYV